MTVDDNLSIYQLVETTRAAKLLFTFNINEYLNNKKKNYKSNCMNVHWINHNNSNNNNANVNQQYEKSFYCIFSDSILSVEFKCQSSSNSSSLVTNIPVHYTVTSVPVDSAIIVFSYYVSNTNEVYVVLDDEKVIILFSLTHSLSFSFSFSFSVSFIVFNTQKHLT